MTATQNNSRSTARTMDYFSAVKIGRARAQRAVELLEQAAGLSYPVLFLQEGKDDWTPVGDENLCALVRGKDGLAAIVVCDSEGNAKSMSGWVVMEEADRYMSSLRTKGLEIFPGDIQLPV